MTLAERSYGIEEKGKACTPVFQKSKGTLRKLGERLRAFGYLR